MSIILGQINLDLSSVTDAEMALLYKGVEKFPHESFQVKFEKNIGFGFLHTYNTPESIFEKLPKYSHEKQLVFVSQGRIDNREVVAGKLGIVLDSTIPDGDLIWLAYQKWGDSCIDYFLGDWSFAVYDIQADRLFLARDKMGYTSLYYYLDEQRFIFSSSPKTILEMPFFTKKVNERFFLSSLLLWNPPNRDFSEQFYEKLFLLPPAHTLSFEKGKINTQRYWFPEHIQVQSGKTPEQYAQELREIFTESVRCRLRSYKPVASMLSGGLDSGSVVTVAAELLKKEGKTLTTLSHVPLHKEKVKKDQVNARRELDETANILATAGKAGNVVANLFPTDHIGVVEGATLLFDTLSSSFHAIGNAYWLVDISQQAQKRGFGTLLTGEMGNASISYAMPHYLLPWTFPWFRNNPKQLFRHKIINPVINRLGINLKYATTPLKYVSQSYIREEILMAWGIKTDVLKDGNRFGKRIDTPAQGMLRILKVGQNPRCALGANQGHFNGLEYRDPTGDVRVIEYCLSIPKEAWISPKGEIKFMLKKMMGEKLPKEVLGSKNKGLQSADLWYRIQEEKEGISRLLQDLKSLAKANEFFDLTKLEKDWEEILDSGKGHQKINQWFKNIMFVFFLSVNYLHVE